MNWGRAFWLLFAGLVVGGVLHFYQDLSAPGYCKGDVELDVYKHRGDNVQVINQGRDDAGNVSVTTNRDKAYLRVPAKTVETVEVSGGDPVLELVGCRGVTGGG